MFTSRTRARLAACATLAALGLAAPTAHAQQIGVNYSNSLAVTQLAPTDSAGAPAFAQTNFNNVTTPTATALQNNLAAAPAARAQQPLTLNNGDIVTASSTGTTGTTGADTVAFTLTGGNRDFIPGLFGPSTLGYTFTLANPVVVSQLGVYDGPNNGPGLNAAVPVTIWNNLGVQLARATVPAGTGTEVNSFLYTPLTLPVALPAGTYTIGAYLTQDEDLENLTTITGAAGITYGASRSNFGDRFPSSDPIGFGPNNYFGPNFQTAAPAAAPEPSQFAVFAVGLLGLGALALKARKRQAA